jgi:hypothetical protein
MSIINTQILKLSIFLFSNELQSLLYLVFLAVVSDLQMSVFEFVVRPRRLCLWKTSTLKGSSVVFIQST